MGLESKKRKEKEGVIKVRTSKVPGGDLKLHPNFLESELIVSTLSGNCQMLQNWFCLVLLLPSDAIVLLAFTTRTLRGRVRQCLIPLYTPP